VKTAMNLPVFVTAGKTLSSCITAASEVRLRSPIES
jgi:hypothetical protein